MLKCQVVKHRVLELHETMPREVMPQEVMPQEVMRQDVERQDVERQVLRSLIRTSWEGR